jgi:DnaJ-class molecular chaperone
MNPYQILGIDETATQEEIKKAYRKLSLKYHPDKNNGDDTQFKQLNEAYNLISTKEARDMYDRKMPEGMPDIFQHFFSQMGVNGGFPSGFRIFHNGIPINIRSKPDPINIELKITLSQAFNGLSQPIEIERSIHDHILQERRTEKETIYIPIKCGIDDGEIIIIENKGNIQKHNDTQIKQGLPSQTQGDIRIYVRVHNDTPYERKGLDLIYRKKITLKQSLCGFIFDLPYIDGTVYKINNSGGKVIGTGYTKMVHKMGMKREDQQGNLIILFDVEFPTTLTLQQVDKLKEIL